MGFAMFFVLENKSMVKRFPAFQCIMLRRNEIGRRSYLVTGTVSISTP